jgi:hypothetical protein
LDRWWRLPSLRWCESLFSLGLCLCTLLLSWPPRRCDLVDKMAADFDFSKGSAVEGSTMMSVRAIACRSIDVRCSEVPYIVLSSSTGASVVSCWSDVPGSLCPLEVISPSILKGSASSSLRRLTLPSSTRIYCSMPSSLSCWSCCGPSRGSSGW